MQSRHPDWLKELQTEEASHHGEMYTKKRHGGYRFSGDSFGHDGSRFHPETCDSFCVRRHGMMY